MNYPKFLKFCQQFRAFFAQRATSFEDPAGPDLQLLCACQPALKANAKRGFGCLHRSLWRSYTEGKDLFSPLARLVKRGSWLGPSVLPGSSMFLPDLGPIGRAALVLLEMRRMGRRGNGASRGRAPLLPGLYGFCHIQRP